MMKILPRKLIQYPECCLRNLCVTMKQLTQYNQIIIYSLPCLYPGKKWCRICYQWFWCIVSRCLCLWSWFKSKLTLQLRSYTNLTTIIDFYSSNAIHLLMFHSATGCDKTSYSYSRGKTTLWKCVPKSWFSLLLIKDPWKPESLSDEIIC